MTVNTSSASFAAVRELTPLCRALLEVIESHPDLAGLLSEFQSRVAGIQQGVDALDAVWDRKDLRPRHRLWMARVGAQATSAICRALWLDIQAALDTYKAPPSSKAVN